MGKVKAVISKLSLANLKKTYYYLKKNGVTAALFAVRERLSKSAYDDYTYVAPSEEELERQRLESQAFENPVTISILVPAYNTDPKYMTELLESLSNQTYPFWELIIADASSDVTSETCVKNIVKAYIAENDDERIRYISLEKNAGISENTNQALKYATGEYVGLLDHDDLLTPDALYENAVRIIKRREESTGQNDTEESELLLLYSDEDKCDETGANYYEIHKKEDFNLDLLMSNNYICHFVVMHMDLMQKLQFRCNFDGSQDYDLILRGVSEIFPNENRIMHIPLCLYHWRCHSGSTAVNPQSKLYAYESGKRALEDFLNVHGWNGEVTHTNHLGFFRITYKPDVFASRSDIGVIGGKLLNKNNRITGGIYKEDGTCLYEGLASGYSGYMHKATLQQDAYAVDIRCMRVREELKELFEEITGVAYEENPQTCMFDSSFLGSDTDWKELSIKFCNAVKERDYKIYWDPEMVKTEIK